MVTLLDPPDADPALARSAHKTVLRARLRVRGSSESIWDGGADGFDAVVYDRLEPGHYDPPSIMEYAERVTARNEKVWVSISANGLTNPDRAPFASNLTLGASSGWLAYVREAPGGWPLDLPNHQPMLAVGQVAALATCHALSEWNARQAPVHVDISAREAALAAGGPLLQCGSVLLNAGDLAGAARLGAPSGWFPCVDGLIRITVLEDHQWERMVEALGSPGWAMGFSGRGSRLAHTDVLNGHIREWTRSRRKSQCESTLQAAGVAACGMYTLDEARTLAQFAWRRSWTSATVDDQVFDVMQARTPDRTDNTDAVPVSDGLHGLRVLEAGHVLAVPLAASLLGAMGADVVKLEDRRRLDSYRATGPFIDGRRDPEWSAYFGIANYAKGSVAADAAEPVQDLVATSDVVLENWGQRRADRWGLGPETLRTGQNALLVRISGFGRTGPMATFRAYAYNISAHSGMLSLITEDSAAPPLFDLASADLITGYWVATMVAAWALGRRPHLTSGVTDVDVAMEELLTERLNGLLGHSDPDNDASPYRDVLIRAENAEFVAGSFSSPDELGRLLHDIGLPTPSATRRPGVWPQPLRVSGEQQPATAWLDLLRDRGAVAEKVLEAQALATDDAFVSDQFFVEVEHPEWGRRPLVGVPWRVHGHDRIHPTPPPLLGNSHQVRAKAELMSGGPDVE